MKMDGVTQLILPFFLSREEVSNLSLGGDLFLRRQTVKKERRTGHTNTHARTRKHARARRLADSNSRSHPVCCVSRPHPVQTAGLNCVTDPATETRTHKHFLAMQQDIQAPSVHTSHSLIQWEDQWEDYTQTRTQIHVCVCM